MNAAHGITKSAQDYFELCRSGALLYNHRLAYLVAKCDFARGHQKTRRIAPSIRRVRHGFWRPATNDNHRSVLLGFPESAIVIRRARLIDASLQWSDGRCID